MLSNVRLLLARAAARSLLWLAFVRAALSPWWPVAAGGRVRARWRSCTRACCSGSSARGAPSASTCAASIGLNGRWAGTGRDGARFSRTIRTRAISICSAAPRSSSC